METKITEKKKKEIQDFFRMVCFGIRAEYEKEASHRRYSQDTKTLDQILSSR